MIRGEKLASLRNLTRVIQLHCPFPENFSRRSALSSNSKTRKNKMGTLVSELLLENEMTSLATEEKFNNFQSCAILSRNKAYCYIIPRKCYVA